MAAIGNTDNTGRVAEELNDLSRIATIFSLNFARIESAKTQYNLTQEQIDDDVSALDVATVQAALNKVKATFQSEDPL